MSHYISKLTKNLNEQIELKIINQKRKNKRDNKDFIEKKVD